MVRKINTQTIAIAQYVFVFFRIEMELKGWTTIKYRSSDIRTKV